LSYKRLMYDNTFIKIRLKCLVMLNVFWRKPIYFVIRFFLLLQMLPLRAQRIAARLSMSLYVETFSRDDHDKRDKQTFNDY